jgi:predicted branched-subunit amino acid permease
MAITRDADSESRFAFWVTGLLLFAFWNLGTFIGALATSTLPDPKVFGLDAAPPAAYLALLAPRLRAREPLAIAIAAGLVALICVPFVPAGVPLLIVAALVAIYGIFGKSR